MPATSKGPRTYNSPARTQQAAETRERIVAAGAELMHGEPIWNWRALTMRAVAQRADVNPRTVYRYFATEHDLRDAVLRRLGEEAGVDIEGLRLEELSALTARMFAYVSTFPMVRTKQPDPALAAAALAQKRTALVHAVEAATGAWEPLQQTVAAAMLDVLWHVLSYERLVADWELSPEQAIAGITWVIDLVEQAIRSGSPPVT